MPYIKVTNIDLVASKRAESNWLYATLEGFNRKAVEVANWVNPIAINNDTGYGIYLTSSGDYTFFRRLKTDGKTDWQNYTVTCEVSQNIVFVVGRSSQITDGFNFRVSINFIELGGKLQADFEYGFSLLQDGIITNWQALNTFDLINEGIYYFDVRLKNHTTTTVGKQSVELYLNGTDTPITGGEESDNPIPGTSSGE